MVCHMHPPDGPYLIFHSFCAFQDNLLEMFLPLLQEKQLNINSLAFVCMHTSVTQFLPCGVRLLTFKFWCSSTFSFRVDFRKKWCHATQINAPCSALHCTSPMFGQERKDLMTMSKHFCHYRSRKCQMMRLWWRIPLYVWIFIFRWI